MLLDGKLTWCSHITELAGKTRKLIYIFKKLRYITDYTILKTVYMALAQSIFSYCITSWGGALKTHLLKLERAQRALLKVIINKPFRYPTSNLYTECDVLSIRKLFILHTIMSQHQKLDYSTNINSRRNDNVCHSLYFKTFFVNKFQCYLGPKLYNKLNSIIKIYSLNNYKCKETTKNWLQTQNYDQIESIFLITR